MIYSDDKKEENKSHSEDVTTVDFDLFHRIEYQTTLMVSSVDICRRNFSIYSIDFCDTPKIELRMFSFLSLPIGFPRLIIFKNQFVRVERRDKKLNKS